MKIVWVAAALAGFAMLGVFWLAGGVGRPVLWDIPAGYRGWVKVEFENAACPPLGSAGVFTVVAAQPSGRGCTSEPYPGGWRFYRFEYVEANGTRTEIPVSGWGGGGEIWAESYARRQATVPYPNIIFFVGTEAELNNAGSSWPGP